MREILFRGKRLDNGEFVEGFFGSHSGIESFIIERPYISVNEELCAMNVWEVSPFTVGQYTGLLDRNGKRIFEGDIMKIAKKADQLGTYYFPPIEYPHNVFVRFDMCAWCWEVIGAEKYYINFPDAWCHYESEVVGNIYDNPELLEGN